jgi:uncharacterized cupin superfamily protein
MSPIKTPILNIADVHYVEHGHSEHFAAKLGAIARHIGARKLGYRVVVVPPGKKAWPYHSHYANEEMFFILEGSGTLRFAGQHYPVRAGDVIAAPPGPEHAHQLLNTSTAELKYLAVSTMEEPDVMGYPDSGKFGVFAGSAPGGVSQDRNFAFFGKLSAAVDYWEDEN